MVRETQVSHSASRGEYCVCLSVSVYAHLCVYMYPCVCNNMTMH